MLHSTFHGSDETPVLTEDGNVEIVVIVCDYDLADTVYPNPDGIICDPSAADGSQKPTLVVKHHDAVAPVVADEDLLGVINGNSVGEVDMLVNDKSIDD